MLDNHTKLVDGGDEWRGQFVKNRFDSFQQFGHFKMDSEKTEGKLHKNV